VEVALPEDSEVSDDKSSLAATRTCQLVLTVEDLLPIHRWLTEDIECTFGSIRSLILGC
jgi:hypothetical protein